MKPKMIYLLLITLFVCFFYSQTLFSYDSFRYYVAVPVLNIREKPDVNSKVVGKLKAGWNVDVIEKGKTDKIGDIDGQWFYVKSNDCDYESWKLGDKFPEGWVFSYYLYDTYKSDLEKIINIKLKDNKFTLFDIGDGVLFDYTINEDGSYSYIVRNPGPGEKETDKGHIYKFMSLYIFDPSGIMFYTDKNLNFIIVSNQGTLFNKEQTEGDDGVIYPSLKEGFYKLKLQEEPKSEPVKKEKTGK